MTRPRRWPDPFHYDGPDPGPPVARPGPARRVIDPEVFAAIGRDRDLDAGIVRCHICYRLVDRGEDRCESHVGMPDPWPSEIVG